jgi:hypothetical protein
MLNIYLSMILVGPRTTCCCPTSTFFFDLEYDVQVDGKYFLAPHLLQTPKLSRANIQKWTHAHSLLHAIVPSYSILHLTHRNLGNRVKQRYPWWLMLIYYQVDDRKVVSTTTTAVSITSLLFSICLAVRAIALWLEKLTLLLVYKRCPYISPKSNILT